MIMFLSFMAGIGFAERVVQTNSFWKTTVEISSAMQGQTLALTITKTDQTSSLLVLASRTEVSCEFTEHSWEATYDYLYFEGWALQNKEEFTMTVPSEAITAGDVWQIGVFKDNEAPVEYILTVSTLSAESCSPDCKIRDECNQGICECLLSNSKGENCGLSQSELALDQHSLLLAPYEWHFYRLTLPSNYGEVTFAAEKQAGAPYLFVLTAPSTSQQVASMFDFSIYMYFDEQSGFSHTYSKTEEDFWLLSLYCKSDEDCQFDLEITGAKKEETSIQWLVLGLIITVSVLCFSIPVVTIIILRIRTRSTQSANSLQPDTLEREFPSRTWEEVGQDTPETCTICLEDFDGQARVRVLHCKHVFHSSCIDSWATSRPTCPLCKNMIVPTVLNTTVLTESPLQPARRVPRQSRVTQDIELNNDE